MRAIPRVPVVPIEEACGRRLLPASWCTRPAEEEEALNLWHAHGPALVRSESLPADPGCALLAGNIGSKIATAQPCTSSWRTRNSSVEEAKAKVFARQRSEQDGAQDFGSNDWCRFLDYSSRHFFPYFISRQWRTRLLQVEGRATRTFGERRTRLLQVEGRATRKGVGAYATKSTVFIEQLPQHFEGVLRQPRDLRCLRYSGSYLRNPWNLGSLNGLRYYEAQGAKHQSCRLEAFERNSALLG